MEIHSLVDEFSPHAGLAAEDAALLQLGGVLEVEGIALVVLEPVAARGDVVEVPAGGEEGRVAGRRHRGHLAPPVARPDLHDGALVHAHAVVEDLLPDDGRDVEVRDDVEDPLDVELLQLLEPLAYVVLLHEAVDLGVALPAVEGHLVAAEVDVLVGEPLADFLQQPPHEVVELLPGRVHRAQFAGGPVAV